MHHGCYKLCPKVREQLRKAQEDSPSDERPIEVAGPSGVQKVGSPSIRSGKESNRYPASTASPKRTKTAKHPEATSKSTTESRRFDVERKVQRRSQEIQFSRREHVPGVGKKGIDERRHPEVDKQGPSRKTRDRRRRDTSDDNNEERSINGHELCGPDCRMRKKRTKDEPERLDGYVLNKTLSYFADLCNCNCACLMNQLWKDPFVTSTIASAAVFAIGVKLCSELNGWTI